MELGWDYVHFASSNGINRVNGKRSHEDTEVPVVVPLETTPGDMETTPDGEPAPKRRRMSGGETAEKEVSITNSCVFEQ